MLKTIAFLAVAAIAVLLVYAATRPDTFRVEREARVKASPEKIYALINDLHQFNTWNPWLKKDPGAKGTYEGPQAGSGAAYGWESKELGIGRMQIVEVAAPSRVAMKLDFIKPFEAHNQVEFTLKPDGDATQVNWAMHGPSPFISKLMQVFFSMDRVVGKDFEDGLAGLKAIAERG
jgi:uncharacterized protein YndB with AHSA1/START domain